MLTAAHDVSKGHLLYRDVYVPVTPGVYLIQGFAFKLFGSSFLVSRVLMSVVYALCVVLTFAIATGCLPLRQATLAGVLAIPLQVWMWPHAQFFSYNPLAILFCVLAIRLAWSIETSPRRRREAFWFGVALAAALWTKPNLAVATGAGVFLYWLSGTLRTALHFPTMRTWQPTDLLRDGLSTLGGAAALSLPLIGYLTVTGILDDMTRSLYALSRIYGDVPPDLFPGLFPLTAQIDAVRLNPGLVLPGMFWSAFIGNPSFHYLLDHTGWIDLLVRFVYYTPVALFAAAASYLGLRLRRRSWEVGDEAALLVLCAGFVLFLTIAPHPAIHYMTPTLLPLLVLTVFLGYRAAAGSTWVARGLGRWLGAGAVSVYLAASLSGLILYLSIPRAPVHTARGTVWVDRLTARLWNEIFDHLDTEMSDHDRIFAVPYFPILYFLMGLEHPTRFVDLRPGSPGWEAEDEIVSTLEREEIEFVLYAVGSQYPAIESFESAYPRLHRYILTRFELEREFLGPFGPYAEVRRRKPVPASAGADE